MNNGEFCAADLISKDFDWVSLVEEGEEERGKDRAEVRRVEEG